MQGVVVVVVFLVGILQLLASATGEGSLVRIKREDKLVVTTIQSTPYFMMKPGAAHEGYIVDLVQKLKERTNYTFQLIPAEDGKFGSQDSEGNWDGMVGEVVEGKATIAAAPLTVTDLRKTVLDFTVPFMTSMLSLVLLKPKDGESKIRTVKDLTDQTDVKCGLLKGGSTHVFFNTTQDPVLQKLNQMINSDPKNLVASYEEGIGRVRSGGGNFGMVMESVTAEYFSGREPCDLTTITINSDIRPYALAVKKGSQFKAPLDQALGQLKEGGESSELERLRQKWWKSECNSGGSVYSRFQSAAMLGVVFLLGLVGSV